MINVGLIGFGYWGPNLARNFHHNPFTELAAISDFSEDRLKTAARFYPQAKDGALILVDEDLVQFQGDSRHRASTPTA